MEKQKNNQNSHSRLEKARTFLKAKGGYVTAFLLTLGVFGAAMFLLPKGGEQTPVPTPTPSTAPVASQQDERLAEKLRPTPTPSATPALLPEMTPAPATPAPRAEKAAAPVEGKVVWKFAMDSLLYSETLDQWTTHSGIDISCKKGEEVHAVWDGTVEEVYEDARLGYTVVLSHSEKRRSIYANLNEDIPVKVGEKVRKGAVLGTVGNTAITECGTEPHLHFEVIMNNAYVDPASYLLIGE